MFRKKGAFVVCFLNILQQSSIVQSQLALATFQIPCEGSTLAYTIDTSLQVINTVYSNYQLHSFIEIINIKTYVRL
jgi:hypothetical protein